MVWQRDNLYGLGINDANYPVKTYRVEGKKRVLLTCCIFYETWRQMLRRCYSDKFHKQYPSYKGCTVADEWLTFSSFKLWMESQPYNGNCLDKDLLYPGNKHYSKDTCCFIPKSVNVFIAFNKANGEACGLQKQKNGKFTARIREGKTQKHLGTFDTKELAIKAWRDEKSKRAIELSKSVEDKRIELAIINFVDEFNFNPPHGD